MQKDNLRRISLNFNMKDKGKDIRYCPVCNKPHSRKYTAKNCLIRIRNYIKYPALRKEGMTDKNLKHKETKMVQFLQDLKERKFIPPVLSK